MADKKRVVAYCRVSTDTEIQEGSFEAQKSYFEREIQDRGYILVNIYGDKGTSGTKLSRPEFDKMLYDAGINITYSYGDTPRINKYGNIDKRLKYRHILYELSDREPLFDEIWLKNTSRFARNTFGFEIIERLREKGVSVYFLEQNINTKDMASDFLLKLFQLFDEQDSRDKSSKVRWGHKEKAISENTISTTKRIYGFNYDVDTKKLTAITKEAKVIRYIYKLYLEGYGYRRIRNELEKKKYYTRENKQFSNSTLRRILSNEKYCGINVRLKYTYGEDVFNKHSYAHIRAKDEWIVQHNHPNIEPIISEETFYKAQEITKQRQGKTSEIGVYNGISKYAHLIYCGCCGSVYYANKDRGKRFYVCKCKKEKGINECKNPNISEKFLEETINDMDIFIDEQKYYDEAIYSIFKVQYEAISLFNNDADNRVKEQKEELQTLTSKKDRFVEMYADGIIAKAELEQKVVPLNAKIEELQESIKFIGKDNTQLLEDIKELTRIQKTFEEQKAFNKEDFIKHNGIYSLDEKLEKIEKIIVNSDKTLSFKYKLFNELSEICDKYLKDLNWNGIQTRQEEHEKEFAEQLEQAKKKYNVKTNEELLEVMKRDIL